MSGPSRTLLVSASTAFFSDRALVAARLKTMIAEPVSQTETDKAKAQEFLAAANLLHGHVVSQDPDPSDPAVNEAERLCNALIQLPLKALAKSNLHARARFGLAVIAAERNEPQTCATNVALAFAHDPCWSRNTFPSIFQSAFRPQCGEFFGALDRAVTEAERKNYMSLVTARRIGAVVVGAGGSAATLGLLVATGFRPQSGGGAAAVFRPWTKAAGEIWQNSNTASLRQAAIKKIRSRFETQLDDRCRSLALEFV